MIHVLIHFPYLIQIVPHECRNERTLVTAGCCSSINSRQSRPIFRVKIGAGCRASAQSRSRTPFYALPMQ